MNGAVTLPSYAEYQCVRNTWFGTIPAHWKVMALRGVLKQRNEKNNPIKTTQILSLSIAHGVTLYSHRGRGGNKRKSDLSAYKVAHEGDIVLNSMNVIVGAVGLSRYTGAISPVYYALYPATAEASISYYDKVFSNPVFQRYLMIYGKGILIKKSDSGKFNTIRMKISPNDLKGTLLPLPSRPEQDQIVAYLRAQDAHIARFIKAKRDLVALLIEQKLRIIDQAVMRGLDASVKLKPSGVEWLGEVPEHWEAKKLKFATKRIVGGSTPKSDEPSFWDGGVVWVTPRDVSRVDALTGSLRTISLAGLQSCSASLVPAGSIVITSRAPVGNVAVAQVDLCTNQGCKAIVTEPDVLLTEYLFLLLLRMKERLQILANGTTFAEIGAGVLANEYVPVPPVDEQRTICRWITEECRPLDEDIVHAHDEIKLIREYRDRLIADVVTGQVDVRSWRPGPDDIVGDDELAALGEEDAEPADEEDADGDE